MFGHSIFNRKHADKMMEAVRRKIQNAPKAPKPKGKDERRQNDESVSGGRARYQGHQNEGGVE
jgi:hypothetical protein